MTMGMMPGPGLAGSGVLPTQTTFSATNKSSDITLGSGNTSATTTSASSGGIVLSNTVKTTGKFYIEIQAIRADGSDGATAMGLHIGTSSLTLYLGQDANGFGSWAEGVTRTKRDTTTNAVTTNAITVPGGTLLNQIARLAVDVDAGKLWLGYFESTFSAWVGGGDPASGTSPTYTFTAGASAYFAACPRASSNTLRLTNPSSWQTSAPSGFGVWT